MVLKRFYFYKYEQQETNPSQKFLQQHIIWFPKVIIYNKFIFSYLVDIIIHKKFLVNNNIITLLTEYNTTRCDIIQPFCPVAVSQQRTATKQMNFNFNLLLPQNNFADVRKTDIFLALHWLRKYNRIFGKPNKPSFLF